MPLASTKTLDAAPCKKESAPTQTATGVVDKQPKGTSAMPSAKAEVANAENKADNGGAAVGATKDNKTGKRKKLKFYFCDIFTSRQKKKEITFFG